jgi:hypothetical protein
MGRSIRFQVSNPHARSFACFGRCVCSYEATIRHSLFWSEKKNATLGSTLTGQFALVCVAMWDRSARTQAPTAGPNSRDVLPFPSSRTGVWPCETVAAAGGRDQPLLRASNRLVCVFGRTCGRPACQQVDTARYLPLPRRDRRRSLRCPCLPACLLPAFKGKDTVNERYCWIVHGYMVSGTGYQL